ncbi:MAG: LysM peptidoglycan-binding domain-containing protein [Bacillota bacterium]
MGSRSATRNNATRRNWRLKNRGRLGLLVAGIALLLSSIFGLAPVPGHEEALAGGVAGLEATAQGQVRQVVIKVVVQPGDTLWTLASKFYPRKDPRSGVAALRRENGLTSGSIIAGQTIKVQLTTEAALSLGLVAVVPADVLGAAAPGK